MGSCCTVASPVKEAKASATSESYSSVLFHPDTACNGTKYNLVYRPPNLNDRLHPGEARPRFWVSPTTPPPLPAIVSVAWAHTPQPYFRSSDTSSRQFSRSSSRQSVPSQGGPKVTNGEPDMPGLVSGKDTLDCGDNNLVVKAYPHFILPFINKVIRVCLVCSDPKMSRLVGSYCHLRQGQDTEPSAELSYLIRNMRWLRLRLAYSHAVCGLPEVTVEEHHGGIKRLRKIRYRPMPVTWIDMDHRKPAIKIVGDSFLLDLELPSPELGATDFPESNGELPAAIGTYIRNLDTCADTKIHFSARLFRCYNQSSYEECPFHQNMDDNVNHVTM